MLHRCQLFCSASKFAADRQTETEIMKKLAWRPLYTYGWGFIVQCTLCAIYITQYICQHQVCLIFGQLNLWKKERKSATSEYQILLFEDVTTRKFNIHCGLTLLNMHDCDYIHSTSGWSCFSRLIVMLFTRTVAYLFQPKAMSRCDVSNSWSRATSGERAHA